MKRKPSRRLNLRIIKINNLTSIKIDKFTVMNGPWELSKELAKSTNCSGLEYGKMRKFKKYE